MIGRDPTPTVPWWVVTPACVLLALGALVDLWARDWRLFAVGVVVLVVSAVVAVRRRRAVK